MLHQQQLLSNDDRIAHARWMTIVHVHVGIVASTYQSIPWHEERRNDKAINAVCQLSSEEDDPLVEEETIEANGS